MKAKSHKVALLNLTGFWMRLSTLGKNAQGQEGLTGNGYTVKMYTGKVEAEIVTGPLKGRWVQVEREHFDNIRQYSSF